MWKWLSFLLMGVIFLLVYADSGDEMGERIRARASVTAGGLLSHSAARGNSAGVRILLRAGAPPDHPDRFGVTPLGLASLGGHLRAARALVLAGADPNAADRRGNTPLILASEGGDRETVLFLLAAGADPRLENIYGWRAGDAARHFGHADLARLLPPAVAEPEAAVPGDD